MDAVIIDQCSQLAQKVVQKLDEGALYVGLDDRQGLSACLHSLNELGDSMVSIIGNLQQAELKELLIQLYEHLLKFVIAHEDTDPETNVRTGLNNVSFMVRRETAGRPSIMLDMDTIRSYKAAGVRYTEIAESFGISRSTLYRRISSENITPPTMSDQELYDLIVEMKQEDVNCGEPYISGEIKARGYYVPRQRIRRLHRIVDPVGCVRRARTVTRRRSYHVKGPNYLWHIDANEKLQPYRLYIHGAVDGYSRKIIYLKIARDKKAATVANQFKLAAQEFGWPKTVRSDKGLENVTVARLMLLHRGPDTRPFITGRSVHNVRVERLWREVNKVTRRFKTLFQNLQNANALDLDNNEEVFYLHYIFIPQLQKCLDCFKARWNSHKIRTARYKSPNVLYMSGEKAPDIDVHYQCLEDVSEDEEDELYNIPQIWDDRAYSLFPNPLDYDEYASINNFITLTSN